MFRSILGGLILGYSFTQMTRDLTNLHFNGVEVGNLNHSKGTIAKIKECLASNLRSDIRQVLATPLNCTGKLRPVSELFDKMTHFQITAQMHLIIVPCVNDFELLTAIFIDNYVVDPNHNTYKDMIKMVRDVGDTYYQVSQVENGAADGAYAKSQNTRAMYQESVDVTEGDWIELQWDLAHSADLAEKHAREAAPKVEDFFTDSQNNTLLFRYGKEYGHAFFNEDMIRSVSLIDSEQADDPEDTSTTDFIPTDSNGAKRYQPVIQSNLKFAGNGKKFLKNYIGNLPVYIRRMNQILANPSDETPSKVEKVRGLLSKISVRHVAMAYGLFDLYNCLSKFQHGVCTVNQFPWDYYERKDKMIEELKAISNDQLKDSMLKKEDVNLTNGVLPCGTPIVTETRRPLRSDSTSPIDPVKLAKDTLKDYSDRIITGLNDRVQQPEVVKVMKSVFHHWRIEDLGRYVHIANSSGRDYGSIEKLTEQYRILKERYHDQLDDKYTAMKRWIMICQKENLYKGVEDILHLALCSFVKSPLEATAESIGSVINDHGRKSRCSLSPASLSSEVQIAWNAPHEFSAAATKLVNRSVEEYFKGTKLGVRFYTASRLKLTSSTIKKYMEKPSRINF